MQIQNIPIEKILDENNNLHPVWRDWFSRLAQNVQLNLSDDGYALPPRSSVDVSGALNTADYVGNILYDTGRKLPVVNVEGVMHSINTTPLT